MSYLFEQRDELLVEQTEKGGFDLTQYDSAGDASFISIDKDQWIEIVNYMSKNRLVDSDV